MTAQSFDLSVPSITAVSSQSYADGSYATYQVHGRGAYLPGRLLSSPTAAQRHC
jgi:hypothetical protein